MILSLHTRLRDHISSVLNNLYDIDAIAGGLTVTAVLLSSFYILPPAWKLIEVGKVLPGIAVSLYTLGLSGLVWLNARYALRRDFAGEEGRFRWRWWFFSLLWTGSSY